MIDYELENGDIVIRNGDIATVSEPQATRQRLEQKLKLWRGEYWLDTSRGFPWLEQVLGKRPRPEVVTSLIRQLLQDDPEVRALETLTVEFEGVDRNLTVAFRARLSNGDGIDQEVTL